MMFGMVGCEERRKTLIASSVIDAIRLMSTKLGASGFGLSGEAASIWWQTLHVVLGEASPDGWIDRLRKNGMREDKRGDNARRVDHRSHHQSNSRSCWQAES